MPSQNIKITRLGKWLRLSKPSTASLMPRGNSWKVLILTNLRHKRELNKLWVGNKLRV